MAQEVTVGELSEQFSFSDGKVPFARPSKQEVKVI
jgi:hypothetical protein